MVIFVPVFGVLPMTWSGLTVFALGKLDVVALRHRDKSRPLNQIESALTHFAPTPCNPPEYLYAPWPNLPPACKLVSTNSTAGILNFLCVSSGMPRAVVLHRHRAIRMNRNFVSCCKSRPDARRSSYRAPRTHSDEVPFSSGSPMYIPGRFRTASRPSSLSILDASYRSVLAVVLGTFILCNRIQNRAGGLPEIKLNNGPPRKREFIPKNTPTLQPLNPLF